MSNQPTAGQALSMDLASATYADPAQGEDSQRDTTAIMWGRTPYPFPGQNLGTGNRCGHNPELLASDRLNLPTVADGHRLKIVTDLIEKAREYFFDPASVPLLAYVSDKKNLDGSPRQNRSEGREAQSLVWSAIVCVMDYSSLRVGQPKKNGTFRNYTFDEIARMCGLTEPGANPGDLPVACSRFRRAVEVFKKAGAIEVFEQYEETPDGMRGRPAIKTVSEKFLMSMGRISKVALDRVRKKASKSLRDWRNGAVQSGVQTDDEYKKVTAQVRSKQVKKGLFPKPAIKNQQPKDVVPDNSHEAVDGDWSAYVAMIQTRVLAQNEGVAVTGIRAYSEAYAKAGGLSKSEWLSRRMQL